MINLSTYYSIVTSQLILNQYQCYDQFFPNIVSIINNIPITNIDRNKFK